MPRVGNALNAERQWRQEFQKLSGREAALVGNALNAERQWRLGVPVGHPPDCCPVGNALNAERQWRPDGVAYLVPRRNRRVGNALNAERQWRRNELLCPFRLGAKVGNALNAERQWRQGCAFRLLNLLFGRERTERRKAMETSAIRFAFLYLVPSGTH